MKKKALSLLLILMLTAGFAVGCGNQEKPPDVNPPVDNGNEVPDDDNQQPSKEEVIAAWVEDSRSAFLAQSRVIEDTQYFLVTYGTKNTGGYTVEITNVDVQEGRVQVTVTFTEPVPGEPVTQAIEYPYDLEEIEATGLPAVFVAQGAEEYIPQLIGVEYLRPVVAESAGIKVFSPEPDTAVDRQFTVEGVANVYEGNIQYTLLDQDDTVLVQGFTTAAMGDWKYFTVNLVVDDTVSVEESLLLKLYTESAKDGQVQDLVEIPLKLNE